MASDPADESLVSRELEQPCGTGRCNACSAVFSSARALMARKATCFGLRAGFGGSHGATKPFERFSWLRLHTLCAVPALSHWCVFGAFLDSFAREDTALGPHCGHNETGD